MATQVRVSNTTHELLRSLSKEFGQSMQTIIKDALQQYRQRKFLEGLNEDFKALKENTDAWQEELEERAMWDKTLSDERKMKLKD